MIILMTSFCLLHAVADDRFRAELNDDDIFVYDYHFERCKESHNTFMQKSFLLDGFYNGLDWQTSKMSASQVMSSFMGNEASISSILANKGRSTKLKEDLESLGYYYALAHCYGDNEFLKNAYTMGFITSDLLGKVSLIVPFKLGAKIYARFLRLVPKKTQLLVKGAIITASIIYIVQIVKHIYGPRTDEEQEIFSEISNNIFGSTDEVIELNRQYFQELLMINNEILQSENSTIEMKELATRRIQLINIHFEKMAEVD